MYRATVVCSDGVVGTVLLGDIEHLALLAKAAKWKGCYLYVEVSSGHEAVTVLMLAEAMPALRLRPSIGPTQLYTLARAARGEPGGTPEEIRCVSTAIAAGYVDGLVKKPRLCGKPLLMAILGYGLTREIAKAILIASNEIERELP